MIFIDFCTSLESTESFTTGWASLVVITWNLCAPHVCHWHQKHRWIWSRDPKQTQTLQSPQHFRGMPFQHDRQSKMMQLFAQNAWRFGWIWMILGDRFLYLDIFGWSRLPIWGERLHRQKVFQPNWWTSNYIQHLSKTFTATSCRQTL